MQNVSILAMSQSMQRLKHEYSLKSSSQENRQLHNFRKINSIMEIFQPSKTLVKPLILYTIYIMYV